LRDRVGPAIVGSEPDTGDQDIRGRVVELADEVAGEIVEFDVPVSPDLGQVDLEARHDHWIGWLLTLAAVALPVVVLLAADSIPRATLAWHYVALSVQRGDFLIPVLILCAEGIRRWWREVNCKTAALRFIRFLATAVCGACIVICLISTAIATSLNVTADIGKSVTTITGVCFVAALAFGTSAVIFGRLGEETR